MATKGTFWILPHRGGPLWVLVLLMAALLAWVFWEHPQSEPLKLAVEAGTLVAPPKLSAAPSAKRNVQVSNSNQQPAVEKAEPLLVLTPTTRMRPVIAAVTNLAADPQNPALRERVLHAQVALVQQGISPGSLDGLLGPQTRAALRAFQQKLNLAETGALDTNTFEALVTPASEAAPTTPPSRAVYADYTVTDTDLASVQPVGETWLAKSKQTRLDYENILELVSEKCQSHPNLIRWLNPAVNWDNMTPGTVLKLPNTEFPVAPARAAYLKVHLSTRIMEAFDAEDNLLAHFPCSIGQRMEQRPAGELHVVVIVFRPNYTFDPDVFPESAEGRELGRKLILPPGPNNPVGSCWIGLDKPGYGIHGTPRPEQVGRTESHGCFRLANWNAEFLARMAWVGMPVLVE